MGEPRRRLRSPSRAADRRATCAEPRRQRRPRPGPRRRPARRRDRRHRTRLRRHRGGGGRRPRSRSPWASSRAGSRRPPSTSPGSAPPPRTPTSRSSASASGEATLRAVDEAPYRAFAAAGGDLVMLSTAIYPASRPAPAAFSRAIATARAARPPRLRRRFDHRRPRHRRRRAFGGPSQAGLAAARAGVGPAPLHRPRRRPRRPGGRCWQSSGPALSSAAEFEAAAQRVLDLRAGLAGR